MNSFLRLLIPLFFLVPSLSLGKINPAAVIQNCKNDQCVANAIIKAHFGRMGSEMNRILYRSWTAQSIGLSGKDKITFAEYKIDYLGELSTSYCQYLDVRINRLKCEHGIRAYDW